MITFVHKLTEVMKDYFDFSGRCTHTITPGTVPGIVLEPERNLGSTHLTLPK